ncbi:MAG: hypothetical protein Q7J69_02290 [Candidatus Omnitrophota bacterium]|nr:hypothetical protein [Candidatus Omnitrophota bacterium]
MKKIGLLIVCFSLPLCGGCAPVLLATGVVAGYAISRDSVLMDLDQPWDRVWSAAQQEVTERGLVKRENPKRGRLDARVEETDVVVALKQLTPSTVRVVVRARKNLLPKVDVAQKVALGIQRRL